MSNTKIDRREDFRNVYFENFYSLYLDLFVELDGMLLIDDHFSKIFSKDISIEI